MKLDTFHDVLRNSKIMKLTTSTICLSSLFNVYMLELTTRYKKKHEQHLIRHVMFDKTHFCEFIFFLKSFFSFCDGQGCQLERSPEWFDFKPSTYLEVTMTNSLIKKITFIKFILK
jgi:hypothetical protein